MVTFKCDWDCSYCSTDTHSQKTPPIEEIKRNIDLVESNSEVSLTGGEPGFAKREVLEYAISELKKKNCHITVNTNGAFFLRYPDLCPHVNDFFYHCSEDLDTTKEIYRPDPSYNVDYMLVVTDENCGRLEHFLDTYPDITFLIHSADPVTVKGQKGSTLSMKNAIAIYRNYKDRIDPGSALRLLERSGKLCAEERMITL
jgi:hypothetical protein